MNRRGFLKGLVAALPLAKMAIAQLAAAPAVETVAVSSVIKVPNEMLDADFDAVAFIAEEITMNAFFRRA